MFAWMTLLPVRHRPAGVPIQQILDVSDDICVHDEWSREQKKMVECDIVALQRGVRHGWCCIEHQSDVQTPRVHIEYWKPRVEVDAQTIIDYEKKKIAEQEPAGLLLRWYRRDRPTSF